MLKDCVKDEKSYQENFQKLISSLKSKNEGNYRALKKLENLAPLYDAHDFWDSQPVPKAYETVDESMFDKQIDVEKTVSEVKDKPYNLPSGFEWVDINMMDREQAKEVYDLLTQNYVEDDDNMFRFDYSIEFL